MYLNIRIKSCLHYMLDVHYGKMLCFFAAVCCCRGLWVCLPDMCFRVSLQHRCGLRIGVSALRGRHWLHALTPWVSVPAGLQQEPAAHEEVPAREPQEGPEAF